MGKPLSRAKLTWSLVARDEPLAPEGLGAFAFNNSIGDFRLNRALDRISQFNAQGEVAIGESGTAEIATQLPVNPKRAATARRQALVRSDGLESTDGLGVALVHAAQFGLLLWIEALRRGRARKDSRCRSS